MLKKGIRKGFTLIELLVVVAIVGLLAAVVIVSVSGSRKKAQDAKIKNDVQSILSASELHLASDKSGKFQGAAAGCTTVTQPPCKPMGDTVAQSFKDESGNSVMQKAPAHPVNDYTWQVDSGSTKYVVCGVLSNANFFIGQNGATYEDSTCPTP